jgi:hypothetical protein
MRVWWYDGNDKANHRRAYGRERFLRLEVIQVGKSDENAEALRTFWVATAWN